MPIAGGPPFLTASRVSRPTRPRRQAVLVRKVPAATVPSAGRTAALHGLAMAVTSRGLLSSRVVGQVYSRQATSGQVGPSQRKRRVFPTIPVYGR